MDSIAKPWAAAPRRGNLTAVPGFPRLLGAHAPVAQLDRAPGFEPGGRGFESLPACQRFRVLGELTSTLPIGRCRIVPSGAAWKLRKRQVRLFLAHRVRVDPKRERRVGVPEDVSDPADRLPRLKRERGPGVAGGVKLQRANSVGLLCLLSNTLPGSAEIPGRDGGSVSSREDPRRRILAALGGRGAGFREDIEQVLSEGFCHRDAPRLAALRRGDSLLKQRAANPDSPGIEIDVTPPERQDLAAADSGRKERGEDGCEFRLRISGSLEETLNLFAGPVLRDFGASGASARDAAHELTYVRSRIPLEPSLSNEESAHPAKYAERVQNRLRGQSIV